MGGQNMSQIKKILSKLVVSGIVLYLLTIRFCDVSAGIPLGQHPLETGWENTGLAVKSTVMEDWGKVSDRYETHDELLQRLKKLQGALGLYCSKKPLVGGDPSFRYINSEGVLRDGGQVIITLQSMNMEGKAETHLGFNLHYPGKFTSLDRQVTAFAKILQRAGVDTPITVAMSGEQKGRLRGYAVERIFERFFQGMKAVRVDGGLDETYNNWRGRTRLLPGGMSWHGERINLESSAVYDPQRDVTVITLATPGITEGL